MMGVVDRHMPIDRVSFAAGLSWESAQVRENEIRDPQIGFVVFEFSHGVDARAEIDQLHVDRRRQVSRDQIIMGFAAPRTPR